MQVKDVNHASCSSCVSHDHQENNQKIVETKIVELARSIFQTIKD